MHVVCLFNLSEFFLFYGNFCLKFELAGAGRPVGNIKLHLATALMAAPKIITKMGSSRLVSRH